MGNKEKRHFSLMIEKYKIKPAIKHYSCMVDVLGNAGLLVQAEQLIRSMPINEDAIIWGSLLSACKKHGNVDMAKRAAKHDIEFDLAESSRYVLMSNVYAATTQFEEAIKAKAFNEREAIRERTRL